MELLSRRKFFQNSMLTAGAVTAAPVLGAGAAISIAHYKSPTTTPDGISEEARRLTRAAVDSLGGMGRFVGKGQVVWVKPNIAWDRTPEQAANTNPDVVAAVVEMCYKAGARRVVVSDNTCNSAQRTFAASGIQKAAGKAGAEVLFMDSRKFRRMQIKGAQVLREWEIYQDAVEADRIINIGIVKHHGLCRAALGIKNLMGVAGGARNRFHQDLNNTLTDLAAFLKPQLVVLDAVRVLTANGPVGGNLNDVKRRDTVVAGVDQVAVDAVGATLLGRKPEEIGYIVHAHKRGLGRMDFDALSPQRLEV